MQLRITDLSPSVTSSSTEHGSKIKLTSEILTELKRRETMREKARRKLIKAGKFKRVRQGKQEGLEEAE
ncbi:hypothetical protein TNCV_1528071 [Trichonephila clavipes]|nr:hypothetical protein TNCV_1528071 [Trichonephila clavipes]